MEIDYENMSDRELIELAEAIEYMESREAERNDIYKVVRRFNGRYVVLIGGSGSGKSYEIAELIMDRIIDEPAFRPLCVRANRNQVSDSQFPLLKDRAYHFYPDQAENNMGRGSEKIYTNVNKSEVVFAGLDDVDKLRSIFDISSVWVEEGDQITAKDFRELNRRLRGYSGKMQIYLTFNPVSIMNWIKGEFFDNIYQTVQTPEGERLIKRSLTICGKRGFSDFDDYRTFSMTDEEMNKTIMIWSSEKQEYIEELQYTTLIIHSTYLDNKHIDGEYASAMQRLKETDIDEYNVYALGRWGVAGGTYFNKASVNARIEQLMKSEKHRKPKTGYFEYKYEYEKILDDTIKFIEDPAGYIKIFKEPIKDHPYTLSGDTAGDGSDWNTGEMDDLNGVQVATIRVNHDEDLYAQQMYCLGKYYGKLNNCYDNALMAIETNFSTHPNKEVQRLGYDHLFVREQRPDDYTGKLANIYGWNTNKATRPDMLGMLRSKVRDEVELFNDLETLSEMTTFVKNEKGRPEAAKGAHDDMIIVAAINCYVRRFNHQSIRTVVRHDMSKLPQDLQEDYDRASSEIKQYLKAKWIKQGII